MTATAAQAATGCKVEYKITNQWGGGYGADVTVTNLGDPVSSWTVGWTFTAGQKIQSLWNGNATQSGSAVSVASLPYNGSLGTNGKTNFGFNGSWSGSNPIPSAFTLNGTTCTGTTPTQTPTPTPTVTRDPDADPHGDADPDADARRVTTPAEQQQLLPRPHHAGVPRLAVGGRHRQGAAREDRPDPGRVLGGQLGRRVARPGGGRRLHRSRRRRRQDRDPRRLRHPRP